MGLKSDAPMTQTLGIVLIKLFDFRIASPELYKHLFSHLLNEDKILLRMCVQTQCSSV